MFPLQFGLKEGAELCTVLSGRREQEEYQRLRYKINPRKYRYKSLVGKYRMM